MDTLPGVVSIQSVSDPAGNIYATGLFSSQAIFGSFTLFSNNPIFAGFLIKYDKNGNCLWAQKTAASGGAIALIKTGGFYVTGNYGFLSKCDDSGTEIWTKHVQSPG